MNARLPLPYTGPTSNPCADAERWENELERKAAAAAEIQKQAERIIFEKLRYGGPQKWFAYHISAGAMYSPEEIATEAVDQDEDSRKAYLEMISSPAGIKFLRCSSAWFAREHAQEIYDEHRARTSWLETPELPEISNGQH